MKEKERMAVERNRLETRGTHNRFGCDFIKSLNREEFKIYNAMKIAEPTKGEMDVIKVLEANRIEYIRNWGVRLETEPKKLKVLYFDFYLPRYNLFIEYDAAYHFVPIRGEDALYIQKLNDSYKDRHCKKHKVHLLRIPYNLIENTESLLCEYLDKIEPNIPNKKKRV